MRVREEENKVEKKRSEGYQSNHFHLERREEFPSHEEEHKDLFGSCEEEEWKEVWISRTCRRDARHRQDPTSLLQVELILESLQQSSRKQSSFE